MAKVVEIDETEFLRLQGLNNFAHKMLTHPEAGKLVEQAAKLVDPNTKTPRLDQDAAASAPIKALEEKIANLTKTIEDSAAEAAKNQTLAALQKTKDDGLAQLRREGWLDEGIKKVEELMEKKGILDPVDAAAIIQARDPVQTPAMPGGTGAWNFLEGVGADDTDADLKRLLETKGENDLVSDQIARKALNEVRQTVRR